jgi:hypothetical protein
MRGGGTSTTARDTKSRGTMKPGVIQDYLYLRSELVQVFWSRDEQ